MAYFRTLSGTDGDDYYRGDDYGEKLLARGGDDDIGGGGGDDLIRGGDGNDLIEGGTGNDILFGGRGIDAVSYAYAQDSGNGGVQVDLRSGLALDFADHTRDEIHGFEVVIGSNYGDVLLGWTNGDDLRGGAGGDVLYGNGGDDTLRGDAGDDLLDGGAGFDFVDYFYGAAGKISLRSGDAWLADGDHDQIRHVEGVHGSQGGDTIIGDSAVNELWGEIGDDSLSGGGGDDRLIGGAGSDRLVGALGADTMWGGTEADKFVFVDQDTWVRSGGGPNPPVDTIVDFSHDEGDRISLRAIDANSTTDAKDAFHFIGDGAFTGMAGELHTVLVNGATLLEADRNGDGAADFSITLLGEHTLVLSDFVL